MKCSAATFRTLARFCVIHQDPAHQRCTDREEMRAAFPVDVPLLTKLDVGLVYKRRCLQCMTRPLASKKGVRPFSQIVVKKRENIVSERSITLAPCLEHRSYLGCWRAWGRQRVCFCPTEISFENEFPKSTIL